MADIVNVDVKADAYKGDGMKGLGDFLTGIATAYREIDKKVNLAESHLTDIQKAQVQSWVDSALARFQSVEFSKSSAVADTVTLTDAMFNKFREESLPQIYVRDCMSGVYNSTTSQLLANDAYARKVREAAEMQVKTIVDYAGVETGRSAPLAQSIQSALNDATTRTEVSHEELTPKTEAFSSDMAVYIAAMSLLDYISRKYFADTTE